VGEGCGGARRRAYLQSRAEVLLPHSIHALGCLSIDGSSASILYIPRARLREMGDTGSEGKNRLLAFDTASPYVWEYRGALKRFSFRVAYRGVRERDVGTLSPEETMSVGG